MALTFTQAKATLDTIAQDSEFNRQTLEQIKEEANVVVTRLTDMEATYQGFAAEINTTATANPGDVAWENVKAEKDKLVADFLTLKTTAEALVAAINAI